MKKEQKNWPLGIKKTKQRESVISVLEHSEKPLTASDICTLVEQSGEAVWLSTIYRILELFVKKGVVIKTNMMNSEMAVYEINRFQHKHYAVCVGCNKMITMDNCPMEKFIPKLNDDFFVMGHNLEIYGLCGECKS